MTRAPSTIEISADGITITAPSPEDSDIHKQWLRAVWPVISDRHGELIRGLDITHLRLLVDK